MLTCEDCLWRRTDHPPPARGSSPGPRADLWQEEECRGCLGFQVWCHEGRRGWGWNPLTLLPRPGVPPGDSPHSSLMPRGRPPQQSEGPASPETSLPLARPQME